MIIIVSDIGRGVRIDRQKYFYALINTSIRNNLSSKCLCDKNRIFLEI